jgi:hypothetical protein
MPMPVGSVIGSDWLDDFQGIRAPTRAAVFWEEPEGRFTYWRGKITALDWE